jgi:hypothetical protein
VRSHLHAWSATVLVLMIALSGCGGKTVAKSTTSAHARLAKPAPAYRVGQYCVSSREAKYRAAGLTCRRHHLARR